MERIGWVFSHDEKAFGNSFHVPNFLTREAAWFAAEIWYGGPAFTFTGKRMVIFTGLMYADVEDMEGEGLLRRFKRFEVREIENHGLVQDWPDEGENE